MPINYLILVQLVALHFVCDYVLQPDKWVDSKKTKKWASPYLYIHALIHGLLAWLVAFSLCAWWIGLTVFITHLLIDAWKVSKQNETYKLFLIDQTLHLFILILCWIIYTQQFIVLIGTFQRYLLIQNVWIVASALILLFKPSSVFIRVFVSKWNIPNNGLDDAGKYIGYLERVLTFVFIIGGMYEAIGFLVAAKSILRLGNLRRHERSETEYVLIGTFISFLIATVLGVAIKHIIK
jgi:hypothetical protein